MAGGCGLLVACSSEPTKVVAQIERMQVEDDRLIAITVRDADDHLRTFLVKDPGALNAFVRVEHLKEAHQDVRVPVTIVLEKAGKTEKVVRIDD